MPHFLYAVSSDEPAPAGSGDAASWLQYYKLENEDEVYIPCPAAWGECVSPGDIIWFAVNREVHGFAVVTRTQKDAMNQREEIWFDGSKIYRPTRAFSTGLKTAPLHGETALRWQASYFKGA